MRFLKQGDRWVRESDGKEMTKISDLDGIGIPLPLPRIGMPHEATVIKLRDGSVLAIGRALDEHERPCLRFLAWGRPGVCSSIDVPFSTIEAVGTAIMMVQAQVDTETDTARRR
jgi:hypothetical protein